MTIKRYANPGWFTLAASSETFTLWHFWITVCVFILRPLGHKGKIHSVSGGPDALSPWCWHSHPYLTVFPACGREVQHQEETHACILQIGCESSPGNEPRSDTVLIRTTRRTQQAVQLSYNCRFRKAKSFSKPLRLLILDLLKGELSHESPSSNLVCSCSNDLQAFISRAGGQSQTETQISGF